MFFTPQLNRLDLKSGFQVCLPHQFTTEPIFPLYILNSYSLKYNMPCFFINSRSQKIIQNLKLNSLYNVLNETTNFLRAQYYHLKVYNIIVTKLFSLQVYE